MRSKAEDLGREARKPCPLPHCCTPSRVEVTSRLTPSLSKAAAGPLSCRLQPLSSRPPLETPSPGLPGSPWFSARCGITGARCGIPGTQMAWWCSSGPGRPGSRSHSQPQGSRGDWSHHPSLLSPSTPSLTFWTLLMGPQSLVLSLCGLEHRSLLQRSWTQSTL